jgi:hypothetical protein
LHAWQGSTIKTTKDQVYPNIPKSQNYFIIILMLTKNSIVVSKAKIDIACMAGFNNENNEENIVE